MSINERELGRLLLEEFTVIVGALVGGAATQAAGVAPTGPQWAVTVSADGALRTSCTLTVDVDGAAAFAKAFIGQDSESAIEGALRDAVAQVLPTLAGKDEFDGVQLQIRSVARMDQVPPSSTLHGATLTVAGLAAPLQVGYYTTFVPNVGTSKTRQVSKAAAAEAQQARLDVILDIDLPVVVRFGRTEMSIKALSHIGPGSVIDLGRAPDDPVELLVSNRVVARGEVVVVGGNYGIRIVDVVSPSERMRSMEA